MSECSVFLSLGREVSEEERKRGGAALTAGARLYPAL